MSKFALITVPKAASQWVRDVIFHPSVLAHVPGTQRCEPGGNGRLRDWAKLPDGACAGPFYLVIFEEWMVWARPQDRAVVVLRDPRDLLVSWVYSMAYSHQSEPKVVCFREPLNSLSLRQRLMLGIVHQNGMTASRQWFGAPSSESFTLARYERLIVDPLPEFQTIFASFGWEIPEQTLRDVLAAESFEVRARGRKPGQLNEFSHYRRGVAGDWRNYFDRSLGRLFEAVHPGGLVELGYETNDDWAEALPEVNDRLEAEAHNTFNDSAQLLAELDRLRRRNAALEAGFEAQRALLDDYRGLDTVPGGH